MNRNVKQVDTSTRTNDPDKDSGQRSFIEEFFIFNRKKENLDCHVCYTTYRKTNQFMQMIIILDLIISSDS